MLKRCARDLAQCVSGPKDTQALRVSSFEIQIPVGRVEHPIGNPFLCSIVFQVFQDVPSA